MNGFECKWKNDKDNIIQTETLNMLTKQIFEHVEHINMSNPLEHVKSGQINKYTTTLNISNILMQ